MAVIVYLLSLLFLLPFLILGLVLAKKFKHPFFYYFKIFIIGLFSYLLLSTVVFCYYLGDNPNRMVIIYFENDGIFGCDRFELYGADNEFYIELSDHHYYGTYTLNNNILELDINWNPFLPFRHSIPTKLKIIDGKEIIDAETCEVFFQK
ncbi:MAG: hypothetical protein RLZZ175_1259 [Bacteroidota bacterium]|jgi:hypothetical protein